MLKKYRNRDSFAFKLDQNFVANMVLQYKKGDMSSQEFLSVMASSLEAIKRENAYLMQSGDAAIHIQD